MALGAPERISGQQRRLRSRLRWAADWTRSWPPQCRPTGCVPGIDRALISHATRTDAWRVPSMSFLKWNRPRPSADATRLRSSALRGSRSANDCNSHSAEPLGRCRKRVATTKTANEHSRRDAVRAAPQSNGAPARAQVVNHSRD